MQFRHHNLSAIAPHLIETLLNESMNETTNSGISNEMMQNLRNNATIVQTNENVSQCSICLENININDSCVNLECNHKLQCIEQWCQSHNTCPVCRFQLEQPQNTVRTQRIIVNNITTLVTLNITYEAITLNTTWQSSDTIVDIFNYLRRLHENNATRLLLQIGNRIFKTTESYELLAHTLSQHGITGQHNATLYNC